MTCLDCVHCSETKTWCNLKDIETDWDSYCEDWSDEDDEDE
jgi:hypothetical protein